MILIELLFITGAMGIIIGLYTDNGTTLIVGYLQVLTAILISVISDRTKTINE